MKATISNGVFVGITMLPPAGTEVTNCYFLDCTITCAPTTAGHPEGTSTTISHCYFSGGELVLSPGAQAHHNMFVRCQVSHSGVPEHGCATCRWATGMTFVMSIDSIGTKYECAKAFKSVPSDAVIGCHGWDPLVDEEEGVVA